MARSTLVQSALIVAALTLSNFTVPTLFQVRVFTEEFWIRFNTGGDLTSALQTTWPMVALPALLLLGIRPAELIWPSLSGASPHRLFATRLGTLHLPLLGVGLAILGVALAAFAFAPDDGSKPRGVPIRATRSIVMKSSRSQPPGRRCTSRS